MKTNTNLSHMEKGEIIMYQPDESIRLEVRMEADTVWLTQAQMAILFGVDRTVIVKHVGNIFKTKELDEISTCAKIAQVQQEGNRQVLREVKYFNLDMIISVGFRVNSINATRFRQWANIVLKNHLLHGYTIQHRVERLEQRMNDAEKHIDFFVRTALPPKEGIFFDRQVFDAYAFVSDLIRQAKQRIVLIDDYIDESVLLMLAKRNEHVTAEIVTWQITETLALDITWHNRQYPPVELHEVSNIHDRFLLIDDTQLYTFGGSFKDLGKKLFCFNLMEDPTLVAAVRKMIH